jgi:hypothetical protein
MMGQGSQTGVNAAGGYGPPGGGGYGGPPPPGGGGYGPPGGPPPGGAPPGGSPPGFGGPPGGYGPPGFGGPPPPYAPGFGGPAFGPPGFGPPGLGAPKVHPLAIASLVMGILSIPLCCCSFFGVWAPIGAIVCGVLAMNKIKEAPHMFTGNGLCIAGIVTGGVGLTLDALAIFSTIDDSLKGRFGSF